MSNSGSSNKKNHQHRASIPALLIILIVLTSSAGCIDKGIMEGIVEKVEGDDEPDYVWKVLITDEGNFRIRPNENADPDYQAIAIKIIENVTTPGQQTPTNLKKIMNEENISMEKMIIEFFVVENTHNLNIELKGIFKTQFGEDAPSGGYMELTIIDPNDKTTVEEIPQYEEEHTNTYPQTPVAGKWTIELQGLGLQSPFDLFYSGKYVITIRVEEPKDQ